VNDVDAARNASKLALLAVLHFDLVMAAMNESARRRLEELMQTGSYRFQSDFARKYVKEGEVRSQIRSLLKVFAARGFDLSNARRVEIETCTDVDTLDNWIDRALTAESIDDVFEPEA